MKNAILRGVEAVRAGVVRGTIDAIEGSVQEVAMVEEPALAAAAPAIEGRG
jgi:hypothetical protein